MPPRRKAAPTSTTPRKRRSTRRQPQPPEDDIPEIFQEMLAEAVAPSPASPPHQTHIGRRKASEEPPESSVASGASPLPEQFPADPPLSQQRSIQTVFEDFDDSEEDDVEFEDVDLDTVPEAEDKTDQTPLQLDLSAPLLTPKRTLRRKVAGAAERKLRLDVHKAHILLLLGALQHRNQWCESEKIHATLKPLVSRKTISLIHTDDSKPQYERTRSFLRGMEELCQLWRGIWNVTARGTKRAQWRDDIDLEQELQSIEGEIDFDSFRLAALTHSGSRDLAAQLFCALLRSVAVDTRLVCSLQILPFSAVAKGQTPEKPRSYYTYASTQDFGSSSSVPTHNKIIESPYPVYWVEVFSPSASAWIALDPIVRNTFNKPRSGFEPPASDTLNSMCYVIAFEDDGAAKDVTLRYTSQFNAKTRKSRVESTQGGEDWWSRVMSHFEKPLPEVRDELEDAEFLKKAAQEGMPRNVADFKGHPVYVLERHLRRNEVIHPRREVGKATVGSGDKKKLENVFRRRDVHLCRTADAWYRRGKDVREGMDPLKYAAPRTRLEREEAGDEDDEANAEGMALYAEYQTEVYVPPPVINGHIPKNKFGNLDVYVESMIPPGAIHVRHPLAAKAALVLGISFADAVTGFEFKGRQGTAVIDGAIVSEGQRVAIVAVVVGLQSQILEEIESERSRIALSVWRRWLHALRIRDKIEQEYGGKEDRHEIDVNNEEDDQDSTYQDDENGGGGFMPGREEAAAVTSDMPLPDDTTAPVGGKKVALPPLPPLPTYHEIVVIESPHRLPKPKVAAVPQHTIRAQEAGGFVSENDSEARPTITNAYENDDELGGGFLPEDDMETGGAGGGFVPEEDDDKSKTNEVPSPATSQSVTIPTFEKALTGSSDTAMTQHNPNGHTTTSSSSVAEPSHIPAFLHPHIQSDISSASSHIPPPRTNTQHPLSHQPKSAKQEEEDSEQQKEIESDADSLRGSDTSLLSHDPAEDDAEPEWLLDSLS